ncbi:hypothetical protein E2C01_051217 [Portunus trituberculatus]|uniref:Uncharacterized protein n=1 Tax=Portunus trituberculatus TaxID=210409 RepID=A0A5B7GI45_PORTR|nr:hypothetical protein [Portunus trituberculatus]
MVDSDMRGSERLEDSKPGWKRLKNLFAGMMVRMDKMASEMKQEISESKQETSAVVVRMDKMAQEMSAVVGRMNLMREEMRAAVGEARQFTLEYSKRLRQDLTEEFKEELVAVRQQWW